MGNQFTKIFSKKQGNYEKSVRKVRKYRSAPILHTKQKNRIRISFAKQLDKL